MVPFKTNTIFHSKDKCNVPWSSTHYRFQSSIMVYIRLAWSIFTLHSPTGSYPKAMFNTFTMKGSARCSVPNCSEIFWFRMVICSSSRTQKHKDHMALGLYRHYAHHLLYPEAYMDTIQNYDVYLFQWLNNSWTQNKSKSIVMFFCFFKNWFNEVTIQFRALISFGPSRWVLGLTTVVGRPFNKIGISPTHYKGCWKAIHQMKAWICLYPLIHDIMQNYLSCKNREIKIDFSPFISWTRISNVIYYRPTITKF